MKKMILLAAMLIFVAASSSFGQENKTTGTKKSETPAAQKSDSPSQQKADTPTGTKTTVTPASHDVKTAPVKAEQAGEVKPAASAKSSAGTKGSPTGVKKSDKMKQDRTTKRTKSGNPSKSPTADPASVEKK